MLVLVTMVVGAVLVYWLVGRIGEVIGRGVGWVIVFAFAAVESYRRWRARSRLVRWE